MPKLFWPQLWTSFGGRKGDSEMAITIPRGTEDAIIQQVISVLDEYELDHRAARIDIYRQNSVSVRVRIIDPDFAGLSRPQRSDRVWKYLNRLTDDAQSDISTVLLLTPDESKTSFANFEFDDPTPSDL